MNPMALLTLPASTLRAATRHPRQSSPSGERGERRTVRWALAIMALIGGAMILLR